MRLLSFCGLKFSASNFSAALPEKNLKLVITVNADFVIRAQNDARLYSIINRETSTIDGQVTLWLSRLFGKGDIRQFQKVSGSDLAPFLLDYCANNGQRAFLLGASEYSNRRAVERISQNYNVSIGGYAPPRSSYPFPVSMVEAIRKEIKEFSPDVIFVGMGSPKQEYWMDDEREFLERNGVKVVVGCGGTIDFLSGEISRAPSWMQRLGLESIYRLLAQPSSMRLQRILFSLRIFGVVFRHMKR